MKGSVLVVVLILVTVSLIIPLYFEGFVALGENQLKRFSSYEQLRNFVRESAYNARGGSLDVFTLSPLKSNAESSTILSPDYSKTNIQVEGVDEADIVKTDGESVSYTHLTLPTNREV